MHTVTIDSRVLSTELKSVHQLELATEDIECGPTRGIRAPPTKNVHESTFGTFCSASYVRDGVLSPSTEGGHDYAMRSNNRCMVTRGSSPKTMERTNYTSHGRSDFHTNLVDFSNTVPFDLSKGVGSGDFQLSPSIVSYMALGRCRHFDQVTRSLIPISEKIKQCVNRAVAKLSGCVTTSLDIVSQSDSFLMELRGG